MVRENELQRALLGALPARLPNLRLMRRMVGTAEVRGATVSFGVKGQSDLQGWRRGGPSTMGRATSVEVELKAAGGRISAEQERWAAWCASFGIEHHFLVARKDETIDETIARWIEELS